MQHLYGVVRSSWRPVKFVRIVRSLFKPRKTPMLPPHALSLNDACVSLFVMEISLLFLHSNVGKKETTRRPGAVKFEHPRIPVRRSGAGADRIPSPDGRPKQTSMSTVSSLLFQSSNGGAMSHSTSLIVSPNYPMLPFLVYTKQNNNLMTKQLSKSHDDITKQDRQFYHNINNRL